MGISSCTILRNISTAEYTNPALLSLWLVISFCPFRLAFVLQIDPAVREVTGINVKGSVLIFDEVRWMCSGFRHLLSVGHYLCRDLDPASGAAVGSAAICRSCGVTLLSVSQSVLRKIPDGNPHILFSAHGVFPFPLSSFF